MVTRYARQEVLPLIGETGQKKLSASPVCIIGCGALGSVSAELLARSGIGTLTLVDHDVVDLTNLQRQALYTEEDINKPKASCLAGHLKKINSTLKCIVHDKNLDFKNISEISAGSSLVLDCTDNISTRLLINEFCVKHELPWVHAAAIQEKGVILNILPGGPCFKCIFPKAEQGGSCEELGILNSTSHITSSIQVVEAIKILLGKDPTKEMLRINAWNQDIEKIKVKPDPKCPVCNGNYALLDGSVPDFSVQQCKTRKGWSVKPKSNIKLNLEGIRKSFKVILDTPILIVLEKEGEIIVHDYGELLFKDLKDEQRIRKIASEIYTAGGVKKIEKVLG
jgi:molybdopterin/thiamine biosynthesis adenylyltransferase